jgi:predicted ferric reductase
MANTAMLRGSRPRSAERSARARTTRMDAIGVVTAASMLIVVALWVYGRGVQDLLSGGAIELTSVGRLTGLVASDLLLIQVLLMARIPVVERTYGQDLLARRHRVVGFCSFWLMLAHIGFITVGYAIGIHKGVLWQLWSFTTTYPGGLWAVLGAAALVLAVVTSVRAARRRLRYESWHLLHLYAYAGVALALPHQLWTGTEFLDSRVAAAYWWAAWVLAAGSILAFRFGLPLWRSMRHRLRVVGVVPEGPGVVSVFMRGRRLDLLPVRAGQFFVWRFLDGWGWSRAHPYSLSAAPRPDLLRITVKDFGDGSGRLAQLREGTRVLMEGPYGRLTSRARLRRQVTLIASGIGITPLRALLEELTFEPGEAVLIYRARDESELILRNEIEELAATRGVRLGFILGPRGRARSWLPEGWRHDGTALRDLVPDIVDHDVFICGPNEWMASVAAAARRAGVPDEQIHLERFTW